VHEQGVGHTAPHVVSQLQTNSCERDGSPHSFPALALHTSNSSARRSRSSASSKVLPPCDTLKVPVVSGWVPKRACSRDSAWCMTSGAARIPGCDGLTDFQRPSPATSPSTACLVWRLHPGQTTLATTVAPPTSSLYHFTAGNKPCRVIDNLRSGLRHPLLPTQRVDQCFC
jgi:hypothetical protein